jgi:omega-6 fatty acid desaturase (delta-12 desaturase)
VYWAREEAWDSTKAALEGSSYYRLPRLLQWLTGSIGLHHIHHLRPRIPNYSLQQCLDQVPAMQAVRPLSIPESLKSLRMNLWDEKGQELVSFRSL